MQRIFTSLLSGFLILAGAQAQAQLQFDKSRQELGSLLWQTPRTVAFSFVNRGKEEVVIRDVRPDCGCTSVKWPRTPIAAGATGVIEATFDAELLGHFEKQVAVFIGGEETPHYLTLSGDVVVERKENTGDYPYKVGDVYLSTDNVEFDDAHRGDRPVKTFSIYNAGNKSFTPELMHLPKYLTAEYEPAVIRPGRVGQVRITLDSEQLRGFGLTSTNIYLSRYAGDRVGRDNEIYVSTTLLPELNYTDEQLAAAPELHIDSTSIDMGSLNGKKRLKREVVITNKGKSTLSISALQVYNPGITVSLSKRDLEPGQSGKLKITLNANTHFFKGRRRVLMITNDPAHSKVIIDITVKK